MAREKKPIIELDKPYGKPIAYWETRLKAASFYKINPANIYFNISGKQKQANGRYFRYATPKEIEEYNKLMAGIDATINAQPAPVAVNKTLETPPVDIIPETIIQPDKQDNTLTPFEVMLQKCKKIFNENTK